ncbi:CopG family transcriptional regulator [Desulfonatronovibrio magnus]|uniref:ribbon-helix-helix domain-containing protein n=1 Tax=Desulfonatronovibrio magnus TaxID=698827 RepID=UPI0009FC6187|nr:CopG family transcriptional regulator [Desulfonatronovibrio magnus]
MATTKTYRAIYLSPELDDRIVKKAEEEKLSASKLIRVAVEKYLAGVKPAGKKFNYKH